MLDIKFIREHSEKVKQAVANKNEEADVDKILQLDIKRREIIQENEALRNVRNTSSKRISEKKKAKEDASELIAEMKKVGQKIKTLSVEQGNLEAEMEELLLRVPNIPADDVPVGRDPSDNETVRSWGEKKQFDFPCRPHWETGEMLDIIDMPRASKLSGSGFTLFKGLGAKLERALINFMIDYHTTHHGYKEVFPPFLVTRNTMTGTGQLPKLASDMYRTDADDLFLIPTAEVPVTNIHRDEILSKDALPIYYTAYTACFRREAGSYGKDTKGMIRVHQFDKVEMVKFVEPETSYDELEKLVANAEAILQAFELHYRVIKLCTADLSFAASKCYDLEVWAPGVERYLEVSSCSNFESFQARRINVRYRNDDGQVEFVHTLNGSGVALPRLVIALLETYQNKDGSVTIPDCLRPYMGEIDKISVTE